MYDGKDTFENKVRNWNEINWKISKSLQLEIYASISTFSMNIGNTDGMFVLQLTEPFNSEHAL